MRRLDLGNRAREHARVDMTTSDFLLAFSYRLLSSAGAGWITARLLLVVSAIPCTWLGGKLAGSRSA